MALAPLSAGFQSLPLLPTIKLGPSDAGSRVGGLVNALGPCGSLQRPLLWGWEFLLLPLQPPGVFSTRGLRLYFPVLQPWVVQSASLPVVRPGLSMWECRASGSASGQTACPIRPTLRQSPPATATRVLSTPPLPVSAHPTGLDECLFFISLVWDFLAVRFSVSSGCARRPSVSTYTSILVLSLVYFVYEIPLIGEITWYLSFTKWLISLSMILSSSIHAVTKGKISFFLLLCSIPLCKCTSFIYFLSTHLLMGT